MNVWLEMLLWFLAMAGAVILTYDTLHYFMYKNTLPEKMTLLISADALGHEKRLAVANLLNLLYEQKPSGEYDLIIIGKPDDATLKKEINTIVDASECVYIADAQNVARYIEQSFQ